MSGKQITFLDDDQWPTEAFAVKLPITPQTSALGVIDMQYYCIDSKEHLAHSVARHNQNLYDEYKGRVNAVITNIGRLLEAFRKGERRVFYTRHGIQLPDGGDLITRRRSREHASLSATDEESGHMPVKGSHAYEIISQLAPQPGDLVLDKNTSSAFHTTSIDMLLRNMNVQTIVLGGIASDQCVFATALDAADRGFHVIIAADACASFDPGSAEAVQILFGRVWGYVMQTEDIIDWLQTGGEPLRTRLEVKG